MFSIQQQQSNRHPKSSPKPKSKPNTKLPGSVARTGRTNTNSVSNSTKWDDQKEQNQKVVEGNILVDF